MATAPVEILSPDGELADTQDWLLDPTTSTSPYFVVAIAGPQASGKSTLANALFHTSFPIASRAVVGEATTRGIHLAQIPPSPHVTNHTLVLDVEGADARARGRDAKAFAARCAAFVTALADVVIVNFWFHDACRLDSAAYSLIRSVLYTCAEAFADGTQSRTSLVVAIRDADDDSTHALEELSSMIQNDVGDIWADVALEAGLPVGNGGTPLSELVDLHVIMFPHIRHQSDDFDKRVAGLKLGLYNGEIATSQHSKQIPADGFSVYAHTLWQSIAVGPESGLIGEDIERKADDFYSGEDFAIVAAYRCDEIFSLKLADASGDIGELLDDVEGGTVIADLGKKCDEIVTRTLQEYDADTSDFADEPVYERKRTELEAIIDTGLMSVFMKNIAVISREALATFKSSIASEVPADYALYNADALFVKRANEGIRQGSSWTFATERTDLQNMMQEIAAQQRKLHETEVSASQEQTKAMQFLQMQHAQMNAVRQQALGGSIGQWNLGAAYRPPDSNVNLSLAYQQGKTNLQVSMVPDESATLLGPTGFTAGVGPGNLGMSFNVNF